MVGEPAHADRNRNHIGESYACSPDDPNPQEHGPEAGTSTASSDHIADAEHESSAQGQSPRSPGGKLAARQHHHHREGGESGGEDDLSLDIRPARLLQGGSKNRPGIDSPQTELDQDRPDYDWPPPDLQTPGS